MHLVIATFKNSIMGKLKFSIYGYTLLSSLIGSFCFYYVNEKYKIHNIGASTIFIEQLSKVLTGELTADVILSR